MTVLKTCIGIIRADFLNLAGWTVWLRVKQRESKMRVGKLKWMRQALKRIGHGVAVGQGQFVSRLRSQSGSTTAGISCHTHTQTDIGPACQFFVVLTLSLFQVKQDIMGSVQERQT